MMKVKGIRSQESGVRENGREEAGRKVEDKKRRREEEKKKLPGIRVNSCNLLFPYFACLRVLRGYFSTSAFLPSVAWMEVFIFLLKQKRNQGFRKKSVAGQKNRYFPKKEGMLEKKKPCFKKGSYVSIKIDVQCTAFISQYEAGNTN